MILREVDRSRVLLALLWRMAEALVGSVTVLLGVLVVLLVHSEAARAAFTAEELSSLVEVLVTAREPGFDLTIFFLSLDTLMYCRLPYRSRLVPRVLSVLGTGSFAIMLVGPPSACCCTSTRTWS
ncbi:DUF4386 family protein [Streptomyces sp. ISL-86]|uniref:DUF4386 family protein n=1 Tax=Streptomyces sp. ISL-86 TaxID=2819187 RepID=UPI001BE4EC09|nr:DUF4386 family protein [Streptomyces sp. ISL-86]MBT2456225.1 DUF4386 family protein [Streptomyces sp. ISL-86]